VKKISSHRIKQVFGLSILVFVLWLWSRDGSRSPFTPPMRQNPDGTTSVEFQGRDVRLRGGDWQDFDEFKSDPNKLSSEQADTIEEAIEERKIPDRPLTRQEKVDVTHNLIFPGFGISSFATRQTDGTLVEVNKIEIPLKRKDRVLVFHVDRTEHYRLLDDFMWSESDPIIRRVDLSQDAITYHGFEGEIVKVTQREGPNELKNQVSGP
jgi:hypothetical protein